MKVELWDKNSHLFVYLEITSSPQIINYKGKFYVRSSSRPYEFKEVDDCYTVPEAVLLWAGNVPVIKYGDFVYWEVGDKRIEGTVLVNRVQEDGGYEVPILCLDGTVKTWNGKPSK